jgi:hypothetical protein
LPQEVDGQIPGGLSALVAMQFDGFDNLFTDGEYRIQ